MKIILLMEQTSKTLAEIRILHLTSKFAGCEYLQNKLKNTLSINLIGLKVLEMDSC